MDTLRGVIQYHKKLRVRHGAWWGTLMELIKNERKGLNIGRTSKREIVGFNDFIKKMKWLNSHM